MSAPQPVRLTSDDVPEPARRADVTIDRSDVPPEIEEFVEEFSRLLRTRLTVYERETLASALHAAVDAVLAAKREPTA